MSTAENEQEGAWPKSHWTQIVAGGEPEKTAGQMALNHLLEAYRRPVLNHLEGRFRAGREQAEDWFHAFVHARVLEGRLLAKADRQRGHFRTFLLYALDNFVQDELRRAMAGKRRPEGGLVPLEGVVESEMGSPSAANGDHQFDVDWARDVLEKALTSLRQFYEARQRPDLWGVFQEGFVGPTLGGTNPPLMAELAQRFGFGSDREASNAMVTAKRMFEKKLRAEVAQYVERESEIDGEIRELLAILAAAA
jgi:hypothetical protein